MVSIVTTLLRSCCSCRKAGRNPRNPQCSLVHREFQTVESADTASGIAPLAQALCAYVDYD